MRIVIAICALLLMAGGVAMSEEKSAAADVPSWVSKATPVKASDIPKSDYPYLAAWVGQHGKPPQDYVIDLYKQHDLVILGEWHNVKEHKDFLISLIPRLYHEAGVRCIAWEFSRQADNDRLEKLVTAAEFDRAAALDFARDQGAHEWDSKEHWDVIEAVWRLNRSLEPEKPRLRFIGIFPDWDIPEIMITWGTKPHDSPECQAIIEKMKTADAIYAQPIDDEILAKGIKGLAYVGRCHDFTHYEFKPDQNFGRPVMANILYKKYGERVFQVWLDAGFLDPIEDVMALRKDTPVGFDLFASPFANILSRSGWDAPEVPLAKIARGYVYLGSSVNLHKNTPIKGFVTEEMFKKYRQYYETDFARKFANAEEVDQYFAEHRFPYYPHGR
jgi:hypothetical protein